MQLPRLIVLTPGDLAGPAPRRFVRGVERALAAGLPGILVREPRLAERDFLALFETLRRCCEPREDVWLALHDRAHLARFLGVPALHLGFRSLAPEVLRPWLGRGIQLGLSTHAKDDPQVWRGADYLFHGPLRATPSKPGVPPVGLEGLRRAVAATDRPILALGGVRPEDVPQAIEAGAWGVAVLAGILGAEDPGARTADYLMALAGAR